MSSQSLTYIYVVFGNISNKRVPFGSFHSRAAAESSIENGSLEDHLENHSLRMSDCNYYTVERWEVGRFLEEDYVKTLTSYDKRGNEMKRFEDTTKNSNS